MTVRHPKQSADTLNAKERALRAMDLRRQGYSYRAIGAELGIDHTTARGYVVKELAVLNAELKESRLEMIQLEAERLDDLLKPHIAKALNGDSRSTELVLKIADRRAKLLGLDAPTRQEVEAAVTSASLDPSKLDHGTMRKLLEAKTS